MPIDVLMPQLSPTMTEGRLAGWTKKEGDKVNAGDVIAEVETDKATMEVEATDDGIIHKIIGEPGKDIVVGTPIAVLAEEGEKVPADYKPTSKAAEKTEEPEEEKAEDTSKEVAPKEEARPAEQDSQPQPAPQPIIQEAPAPAPQPAAASTGEHIKASPLARRLAEEGGIDLATVKGTGPHGRIVKKDVLAAANSGPRLTLGTQSQTITRQGDDKIALSPMRKSIAARLTQSKQEVPHFYLTAEVVMDDLLSARAQINELAPKNAEGKPSYKVSVNDFIIKACALALRDNPDANASWATDSVVRYGNVDVSVAVAIPGGLITPIIFNADQKNVVQMSTEMKALAAQAREGNLKPEQYTGGSFSLSNLGMYGVKDFSAIINPPQAAILAVGGAAPQVVADDAGNISTAHIMSMTMSVDHRVIDGALGAELLASIKNYLEKPVAMLV